MKPNPAPTFVTNDRDTDIVIECFDAAGTLIDLITLPPGLGVIPAGVVSFREHQPQAEESN